MGEKINDGSIVWGGVLSDVEGGYDGAPKGEDIPFRIIKQNAHQIWIEFPSTLKDEIQATVCIDLFEAQLSVLVLTQEQVDREDDDIGANKIVIGKYPKS